jgi:hypothetical protein
MNVSRIGPKPGAQQFGTNGLPESFISRWGNNIGGKMARLGTADPTASSVSAGSMQFSQSNVVFGLFIGYMIGGSRNHDVTHYHPAWTAYLGIHIRGWAAIVGVIIILLNGEFSLKYNKLMSNNYYTKDGKEDTALRSFILQKVEQFIDNTKTIGQLLWWATVLVVFVWIAAFVVSTYSQYVGDLNFVMFWGAIILTVGLGIAFIVHIYSLHRNAKERLKRLSK